MAEPIVHREVIAQQADAAARAYAAAAPNSEPPPNPYPPSSDAAAAWQASFQRFLQLHCVPNAEGSA